jgi:hypothetical protein
MAYDYALTMNVEVGEIGLGETLGTNAFLSVNKSTLNIQHPTLK